MSHVTYLVILEYLSHSLQHSGSLFIWQPSIEKQDICKVSFRDATINWIVSVELNKTGPR